MIIEDLKQIKKELKSLKPRKGILENIKKECRTLSIAKKEKSFKATAKRRYGFISAIAASLIVITLSILLPVLLSNSDTPENYTVGLEFNLTVENFYEVSAGDIKDKDIIIPSLYNNIPVKRIAENGFMNANIESIVIPDSVITIGDGAFKDCKSIESIVIPQNIANIGDSAFYGSGLKNIEIPSSINSIKSNLFAYCKNLVNISMPHSIESIEDGAFIYCISLTNVILPENLKSIGAGAFSNCTSLGSIIIPKSVLSIGAGAFKNCEELTIYCEVNDKPDGWADDWTDGNIDWKAESELPVLTYKLINGNEYEASKGNNNAGMIIIPDEYNGKPVTSIADNAFINSDIVNVIIPDSIKSVGEKAFYGCNKLKSIILPKNVANIGLNAFDITLTIYAEAKSKPDKGWLGEWNSAKRPVVWGCELLYDDSKPYVNSFIVTHEINGAVVYSAPYREGYKFVCWKSKWGSKYDAANINNARNNIKLTSQWLKIE